MEPRWEEAQEGSGEDRSGEGRQRERSCWELENRVLGRRERGRDLGVNWRRRRVSGRSLADWLLCACAGKALAWRESQEVWRRASPDVSERATWRCGAVGRCSEARGRGLGQRIKSRAERSAPEVNDIARERRCKEAQLCRTPSRDDQGQEGEPAKEAANLWKYSLLFLSYVLLSSHLELIACFYYSWLQGFWQGLK